MRKNNLSYTQFTGIFNDYWKDYKYIDLKIMPFNQKKRQFK